MQLKDVEAVIDREGQNAADTKEYYRLKRAFSGTNFGTHLENSDEESDESHDEDGFPTGQAGQKLNIAINKTKVSKKQTEAFFQLMQIKTEMKLNKQIKIQEGHMLLIDKVANDFKREVEVGELLEMHIKQMEY